MAKMLYSHTILKHFLPNDIVNVIQTFNLPKKETVKIRKEEVIKNINVLRQEFINAQPLVVGFGFPKNCLSFFKFIFMKSNEEYQYKNIYRIVGRHRAKTLLLPEKKRKYIYNKNIVSIIELLHLTRHGGNVPMTYELLDDFYKIEKMFNEFLKDNLCNAVCKKKKKNYSLCKNKKTIQGGKQSLFCKRHITRDIKDEVSFLKKNIHLMENYKINTKNQSFVLR